MTAAPAVAASPHPWPFGVAGVAVGAVAIVVCAGAQPIDDPTAALRRRRLLDRAPADVAIVHIAARAGVQGAFSRSDLSDRLRCARRRFVIVVGDSLVDEVHATARQANDRCLEPLVVLDACGAGSETEREAVGAVLTLQGGVVAAVADAADVVQALSGGRPG